MTRAMNSYHFDLGNSNTGPIGFCARITAETPEEALRILRDALPDELSADTSGGAHVEYINVYFNPDAVTVADIDDSFSIEEKL